MSQKDEKGEYKFKEVVLEMIVRQKLKSLRLLESPPAFKKSITSVNDVLLKKKARALREKIAREKFIQSRT